MRCGDEEKCGDGWTYLFETSFTHTIREVYGETKRNETRSKIKQQATKQQYANITISATVTSWIRGLQMVPTQLGAKPSAVSVKNWANTSANLQQLNSNYQVKQPKNDILKRDNTITTSSLLFVNCAKMRYWKYVNTDWLHQDNHGK